MNTIDIPTRPAFPTILTCAEIDTMVMGEDPFLISRHQVSRAESCELLSSNLAIQRTIQRILP